MKIVELHELEVGDHILITGMNNGELFAVTVEQVDNRFGVVFPKELNGMEWSSGNDLYIVLESEDLPLTLKDLR